MKNCLAIEQQFMVKYYVTFKVSINCVYSHTQDAYNYRQVSENDIAGNVIGHGVFKYLAFKDVPHYKKLICIDESRSCQHPFIRRPGLTV